MIFLAIVDGAVIISITCVLILSKYSQRIGNGESLVIVEKTIMPVRKSYVYLCLIFLHISGLILESRATYLTNAIKDTLFSSIFIYLCNHLINSKYDSYWGLDLDPASMKYTRIYSILYQVVTAACVILGVFVNKNWTQCLWFILWWILSVIAGIPAIKSFWLIWGNRPQNNDGSPLTLKQVLREHILGDYVKFNIYSLVFILGGMGYISLTSVRGLIYYSRQLYGEITLKYTARIYWWLITVYASWYVYIEAPFRYMGIDTALEDLAEIEEHLDCDEVNCIYKGLVMGTIYWFRGFYTLLKKIKQRNYEPIQAENTEEIFDV